MCTPVATNAASALLMAQAMLMSKVLAVSAIIGVLALNFRNKISGFFYSILKF